MKYFAAKELVELGGIIYCKFPFLRIKKYDLVLVRTDRIGDYVIWHDTIAAYKQRYPNKKVLLICNDSILTLAREESFFTEILCYNINKIKGSAKYAIGFINTLKTIEAEILINSIWERIWYADIFSMAIKAHHKIAIAPKKKTGKFVEYYNRNYDELIDCCGYVSEIEADEGFAKKTIWQEYRYGNYLLAVKADKISVDSPYAVISFSTSTVKKNWPIDSFSHVIDIIPSKYKIVLIGAGAYDEVCAKKILEQVNSPDRITNYVGKTTIPEMVSIISKASFVLGNDSAAVHIASATNVPSIAILSGTHYKRFLPYPSIVNLKYSPRVVINKMNCFNCDYHCIFPDEEPFECIKRISVEAVEEEVRKMIDEIEKSN